MLENNIVVINNLEKKLLWVEGFDMFSGVNDVEVQMLDIS